MSEVDELTKLAALKEKGVLSEDEFNAKKAEILNTGSSKPKKSRGLLWKIPLALIGLAGLLNAFGVGGDSKLKCDANNAKTTLKGAFDQSQFARTLNLSAIDINDITEKNRDDKAGTLSCRAAITMNTTKKVPVSYKIEQHNDGKFLLTFEVLDESENAAPTVAPSLAQPTNTSAAPSISGTWKGSLEGNGQMEIKPASTGFDIALDVSNAECTGSIEGTGSLSGNTLIISKKEDDQVCTITIKFTGNIANIDENNCSFYHGMACGFSGTLNKVK